MKLRQLEMMLEGLEGFTNPKLDLEQYCTTPHLAACLVHTADSQFGDINGRTVADLGCGCGILSIASMLLGAEYTLGMDIDDSGALVDDYMGFQFQDGGNALSIFLRNVEEMDPENAIDVVQADISSMFANNKPRNLMQRKSFDTVIMNPPYGTKNNQGVDMQFLLVASKLAKTAVYSLHKTSTRAHVVKKANDFGMKAVVVAELRYNLAATYKFHKSKSRDIAVDFVRFSFT